MEFRIQDILKNIIPGATIVLSVFALLFYYVFFNKYCAVFNSNLKEYSEVLLISLLVVFYICGYTIDLIASNIE